MAFDLSKAIGLKSVSNLDTGEMQEIKLSLLDPHPDNFFTVENGITDLCESIKVNGLLQPPVVTPSEGGRYRIIAGHRRHKALQALSEELPDKFGTVLCRVVRPSSPALEELMLIQTNTEAREIGYAERAKAAARVEKILVSLKEQGVELPGKMRSHVARLIKASESQIARAKYISENLIKPLQNARNLSDSAAYKLAHLPTEQQYALHDHYKPNFYSLDNAKIERYLKNIEEGREPFATPPLPVRSCYEVPAKGEYPPCSHCDTIARRKQDNSLQEHQKCANRSCCSHCSYRFDCEDVCPVLHGSISKTKASDTFRIGRALRRARCDAGISLTHAAEELNLSVDQTLGFETCSPHTVASFLRFCELYKVTPNEVLGLESCASSASPLRWEAPSYDIQDGLYTIAYYDIEAPFEGADGKTLISTRLARRKDGGWYSVLSHTEIAILNKIRIVAVAPYPEPPEGYTYCLGGDASGG